MAEKTIQMPEQNERSGSTQETTRAQEEYIKPPVDIYETAGGLTILADLPGVRKEDLTIEVEDSVLTIKARAHHELRSEPIYREFELVNFFRQFQLSEVFDTQKITAEFKHGVLKLQLPQAEKAKPKQISVQVV